jgi:hypothetical protein
VRPTFVNGTCLKRKLAQVVELLDTHGQDHGQSSGAATVETQEPGDLRKQDFVDIYGDEACFCSSFASLPPEAHRRELARARHYTTRSIEGSFVSVKQSPVAGSADAGAGRGASAEGGLHTDRSAAGPALDARRCSVPCIRVHQGAVPCTCSPLTQGIFQTARYASCASRHQLHPVDAHTCTMAAHFVRHNNVLLVQNKPLVRQVALVAIPGLDRATHAAHSAAMPRAAAAWGAPATLQIDHPKATAAASLARVLMVPQSRAQRKVEKGAKRARVAAQAPPPQPPAHYTLALEQMRELEYPLPVRRATAASAHARARNNTVAPGSLPPLRIAPCRA